jgi:hypothetical protein
MALYPLQATNPTSMDILDSYGSLKGGEIGTLYAATRANTALEKSSADTHDGYLNSLNRVAVANSITSTTQRPLWLLDEGISGYGTLFGSVIGIPTGLSTSGAPLGPSTMAGSGKVTCWHMPGLFAVSLDAVDTDATVGLQVTNTSLVPQSKLFVTSAGLLTPSNAHSVGGAGTPTVGRFLEFELTSRSLVTTPASLVGATKVTNRAVFSYHVE